MTKNLEKFLGQLGTEAIPIVLRNEELSRTVKNPRKDEGKYKTFVETVNLLGQFAKETKNRITVDNPDMPLTFHSAIIHLENDELNGNVLQQFADIIRRFDEMMVIGDSEGNVALSLVVDNIYIESL